MGHHMATAYTCIFPKDYVSICNYAPLQPLMQYLNDPATLLQAWDDGLQSSSCELLALCFEICENYVGLALTQWGEAVLRKQAEVNQASIEVNKAIIMMIKATENDDYLKIEPELKEKQQKVDKKPSEELRSQF